MWIIVAQMNLLLDFGSRLFDFWDSRRHRRGDLDASGSTILTASSSSGKSPVAGIWPNSPHQEAPAMASNNSPTLA
jgi:hypothetical protein